MTNWQSPAPVSSLVVNRDQALTYVYLEIFTLTVNVTDEKGAAAPSDIRWKLTDEESSAFRASGTSIPVVTGPYEVEFNGTIGYRKQANMTGTITENTTLTAVYTKVWEIRVDITFPDSSPTTAQWRLATDDPTA